MCLAGQSFAAAPKDAQNVLNVVSPGIGLAAKMENKLYERTMPDAGKAMMDRFMPNDVRQGILNGKDKGAKATLYNKNSEQEEEINLANNEAKRRRIADAFAAKYNNQPKMLA